MHDVDGRIPQRIDDLALERGEGVGGCVVAIEAAMDASFGRNGESSPPRRP